MSDAAVVIGCAAYDDPHLPSLRYAHRDAQRFGEVLRTTCGLRAENVLELTDEANGILLPTRANIFRALQDSATLYRKKPPERLYLFFSGHGFQSQLDNHHYLIPRDAVRGELESTSLPFDKVLALLEKWGARHTVIFLDACRDVVDGSKDLSEAPLARIEEVEGLCPPGIATFYSCRPRMRSYESDDLGLGLFTAGLLEALSETGRCRTVYELDHYLVRRVPQLAQIHQRPFQEPLTRVDSLSMQRLCLVEESIDLAWTRRTPLGAELRNRRDTAPSINLPRKGTDIPALAIDLGTSFSIAMCLDTSGNLHPVPAPTGETLVPSVIHFLGQQGSNGSGYVVGKAAVELDRLNPGNTIRHFKRDLGTDTVYEVAGRAVTPELATSLVLRSLKQSVEDCTGKAVRSCVTAYPASFNLAQRNALDRAFQMADLEPWRMISEPNIGAFAMAPAEPDWEGTALLVDLGGGTLDVAVVDIGSGVYDLQTVAGSSNAGGLDYDLAIARYAEQFLAEHYGVGPDRPDWSYLRHCLRYEAERAKRRLGRTEQTSLVIPDVETRAHGFQDIEIPMDRDLFRSITAGLNDAVARSAREALGAWKEYKLVVEPVGRVLLAGQGSKIFTVREALDSLDLKVPYVEHYQQTAVIQGLGQQLGVLNGTQPDSLLLDIRHRGLGFRAMPGKPVRVSHRPKENTAVATLMEPYTTIPTKRAVHVTFTGTRRTPAVLQLVELPNAAQSNGGTNTSEEAEDVGRIELDGCVKGLEVQVTVDMDASSTMVLQVDDPRSLAYWEFQLSNLHRTAHRALGGWPPVSLLLLSGYRVWPLTRIDQQRTAPEAPLTAKTADLAAEMVHIESTIEDSYNRPRLGRPGAGGVLLFHRAVIRQLMGSLSEACDDYVLAISSAEPILGFPALSRVTYLAFERLIALVPHPDALRALDRALSAYLTAANQTTSQDDFRQLANRLDRAGLSSQAQRCRNRLQ
ncbi:Hsp70 family protein [Streptomyces collinus]